MGAVLRSMPVAFLAAAEGTERSELAPHWETVAGEAGNPVLVSPGPDKIELFDHLDPDGQMAVDVPVNSARGADFSALVLPGGAVGPEQLRTDPAAVDFVRSFFDAGKPVAVEVTSAGKAAPGSATIHPPRHAASKISGLAVILDLSSSGT